MSYEFLVPIGTNECSLFFMSTVEKPSKKRDQRKGTLTYSIARLELFDYVFPGASSLEALTIVLLGILSA